MKRNRSMQLRPYETQSEKLRMLAKSERFYWTKDEDEEFNFLRSTALQSIKRLGYFNYKDDTELYVDASPIGLGAVLVQFNESSVPRVIACASKALTAAEAKYSQTQKEALAMVWGIERFAFYLTAKSFVVKTDSEANEFIFGNGSRTTKRSLSRAEAWALRLQAYDFKVKHVPGHLNVADALSRLIIKSQVDAPFDEDNDKHILYALDAGSMTITWSDIDLASESDVELVAVRRAIQSGEWPAGLRRFEAHSRDLRTLGPRVFKEDKVILPRELRAEALCTAHQGHIGIAAMKRIMRDYFWWPGLSSDVEEFVKNCETCLVLSRRNPPIPLSSRQLPEGPWEVLQIDFLSVPLCGSGEFLVVVDTYSRYISVIEMKSMDAQHTNLALNRIFFSWGLPLIIQSDNGPPFQSREFISLWEAKGVKVRKSIPLSPQSNGSVERQNQGIIKALAGARQDGRNWKLALEMYVHTHNTLKPHSRLGITPFELLVGWKYRGTFPSLWEPSVEVDRYAIRDNDAVAKLISKRNADSRRGAKISDISAGDQVVMAITRKSKTDPAFSREKYTVLARDGAKVILCSERGVQFTRNVGDVKRVAQSIREYQDSTEESDSIMEPSIRNDHLASNLQSNSTSQNEDEEFRSRPKRVIRKPLKFNDMFMYHVFQ